MDIHRRNNVTVTGRVDGPVLLLAHGFGCDQNMWRLVLPALAKDFRVVLFDYVGSGNADPSAWSEERYSSLDGYALDVLEVCEELDLHDVIFVGHSVSAMVGVLAAAKAPQRFSRLVMVAPSPRYIDEDGYRGGFGADPISSRWAASSTTRPISPRCCRCRARSTASPWTSSRPASSGCRCWSPHG